MKSTVWEFSYLGGSAWSPTRWASWDRGAKTKRYTILSYFATAFRIFSHLLLSKGDNCSQAIISHSPISAVLNSLREFWLAYTLVFLTAYFVSYKTCIALFFVFLKLMIYSLQHKNSLRVHWKKSEVSVTNGWGEENN